MTTNNLPPRLYYRLDEAAQLLGCTESDLIRLGASGDIHLLAHFPDYVDAVAWFEYYDYNFACLGDSAVRKKFAADIVPSQQTREGPGYAAKIYGWWIVGLSALERMHLYQDEEHLNERPFLVWRADEDLGVPDCQSSRIAAPADEPVVEAILSIGHASHLSRLFIDRFQLDELRHLSAPRQSGSGAPKLNSGMASPKTLNQQRAFAEQLGGLFGRAVADDDNSEPMTIVMELLEGSKYAHMINSPYALHSALVQEARKKRTELEVGGDALARWLKQKQ